MNVQDALNQADSLLNLMKQVQASATQAQAALDADKFPHLATFATTVSSSMEGKVRQLQAIVETLSDVVVGEAPQT